MLTPRTLPTGADEAGGPPFKVLRDPGQPPTDCILILGQVRALKGRKDTEIDLRHTEGVLHRPSRWLAWLVSGLAVATLAIASVTPSFASSMGRRPIVSSSQRTPLATASVVRSCRPRYFGLFDFRKGQEYVFDLSVRNMTCREAIHALHNADLVGWPPNLRNPRLSVPHPHRGRWRSDRPMRTQSPLQGLPSQHRYMTASW